MIINTLKLRQNFIIIESIQIFLVIKHQNITNIVLFLSVILLDSFVKIDNDYHPQIFLEECKYAVKKKKIINAINEELNSDEPDESDEENNEN